MTLEIDTRILKATTKCTRDFKCLSGKKHIYCTVEDCFGDRVLFVKCLQVSSCSFKALFGDSCVCGCPTRMEIYKKYNT
jgi:hypothetical protein